MTSSAARTGTAAIADGGSVILVRHGQASLGERDYDRLSGRGHVQARHLRDRLQGEIAAGWRPVCGTLRRQRQTLALLAPGTEPVHQEWLNEYTVSALMRAADEQAGALGLERPGREAFEDPRGHLEMFLAWFPGVIRAWQEERLVDPVNGSWPAFRDRVIAGMQVWIEQVRAGETVVMVSSAGIISLVVSLLTGNDLAWQRTFNVRLYNAAVCRLTPQDGIWRADTLNCIRHLSDPGLHTLA